MRPRQTCSGTGGTQLPGFGCVYDPEANALVHNTFSHDGYFANPSNADFGELALNAHEPQNCFRSNMAQMGGSKVTASIPISFIP